MDQIVADNSVKEDEYESKVKDLQEEFKLADTRAEFAERSVDKVNSYSSLNHFSHFLARIDHRRFDQFSLPRKAQLPGHF
jgi:tRNA 2-selenouridine synthase SelU